MTVTSASKAWNLPGLKCDQVVLTNDADAEFWQGYYTPDEVGVGTFGLIANAAAYSDSRNWLVLVMDQMHENRDRLGERLAEYLSGVGYTPPKATNLAWLDFSTHGIDDPALFCLEEAEVALTGEAIRSGRGRTCQTHLRHPSPHPHRDDRADRGALDRIE